MNESMNECVSFGFHCLYVALFLLLSDIGFLCLSGFFELILSGNVKQARTFFRFLFPASSFLLYRALSLFTCAHTHTHTQTRTHAHTHAHTQIHTLPKKKIGRDPLLHPFQSIIYPQHSFSFHLLLSYIQLYFVFVFFFFFVFVFCHYVIFFFFLYFVISLSGWNKYTLTYTHTHTKSSKAKNTHTHTQKDETS